MHKIAALLLLALTAWGACPDSPTGYSYCLPIPVDNTKVSGTADLTNYVGWVDQTDNVLRTVANGGHVQDGADIRFQIGATALDYQLMSYTATTGALKAWVRIPTLLYASDTQVYIYYGKTGASGEPNPSGVWADYNVVYHLNEDPATAGAGGIVDSANANNGTDVGGVSQSSSCALSGTCMAFNGSSGYVGSIADHASLAVGANSTFNVWLYAVSFPGGGAGDYIHNIFGDESSTDLTAVWRIGKGGSAASVQKMGINFYDGTNHDDVASGDLTLTTWTKVTVTTDGTNAKYYYNGTLDVSNSYTITPTNISRTWEIGRYGFSPGRYWDGRLQEIRWSNSVRSGDWVATEYANENAPATFFVKGAEDCVGGCSSPGPKFRVQAIIGVLFWRSAWLLDYWQ